MIICIIKKRNQYKLQARYYTTAITLYEEIQEPLYEVIHAETEGEEHQYDQALNEDIAEIPAELEVSHPYVGDPENPGEVASTDVRRDHQVRIFDISRSASSAGTGSLDLNMEGANIHEQHQVLNVNIQQIADSGINESPRVYEQVPIVNIVQLHPIGGVYERAQVYERVNVNISQLLSVVGTYERAQVYERVPNVNISQLLSVVGPYERAQVYERVPNVNISQLLSIVGDYERAQVYERVPNVNIPQLLSVVGAYERAQVYERVPNVNIPQLLSVVGAYERAQVYERVPNVNIPQLLSIAGDYERAQVYEQVPDIQVANNGSYENSEQMSAYERLRYGEMTMQLIRGVMRPYEQISGYYERVH